MRPFVQRIQDSTRCQLQSRETRRHGVGEATSTPQRSRLGALQPVDEMVEQFVKTLENKKLLDDTCLIYTTDNGYHLSQHHLHRGKECDYEADIHVSLIIRRPGLAIGHTTDMVSSHTDFAPNIIQLAGETRDDFDGIVMTLSEEATTEAESFDECALGYIREAEGPQHANAYDD